MGVGIHEFPVSSECRKGKDSRCRDEFIIAIIERSLKVLGYSVIDTVPSGEEAVEKPSLNCRILCSWTSIFKERLTVWRRPGRYGCGQTFR
jgi:hypothetical protein